MKFHKSAVYSPVPANSFDNYKLCVGYHAEGTQTKGEIP